MNNLYFWIICVFFLFIIDSYFNYFFVYVFFVMIVFFKYFVWYDEEKFVILVFYGVGVDVKNFEWGERMLEVLGVWVVLFIGKNEWGEDWYGGSMEDVWVVRVVVEVLFRKIGIVLLDKIVLV